ncbi:hypothetical protein BJX63DRAFT_443392 [Aspergillus granulosus]|uniref:Uncharacterized protein n=1 Tax=Aspergillus granulosus TaxID=176169 RepID=A0ABR4HAV1_9EURO
MPVSIGDSIPEWGQLPAEQYLIRHWDPTSPESTDQQRELDPMAFGSKPWNRGQIPTEKEIANILRLWRSDQMRRRAWILWRAGGDDNQPVLLPLKSWATLGDYYSEGSDWSISDDPQLLNFNSTDSEWPHVFYILPELSKPGNSYSRVRDWERFTYPTTWRSDPNLLITKNYAVICLLYIISTTQVLVADKETFQTNQLLLVPLDAKQNITMQGHIDITEERLDQLSADWGQREHMIEVCEEGTIGEGYLVNGEPGRELYQWTKQDLEDDPPPTFDVSRVADGVSRMDV